MDDRRFDQLTRLMSTAGSRRSALATAVGLVLPGLAAREACAKGRKERRQRNRRGDDPKGRDFNRVTAERKGGRGTGKGKRKGKQKGKGGRPSRPSCATIPLEAGQTFTNCDLSGRDLSGLDLHDATFTNSDLSQADLTDTNLHSSVFVDSRLVRATLENADLRFASLSDTDLSQADLKGATLQDAEMNDVTTTGTNFEETTMPDGSINSAGDGTCGDACGTTHRCRRGQCFLICVPDNDAACDDRECGTVLNNCLHEVRCGTCSPPRVCGARGGDGGRCDCVCLAGKIPDDDCNCFCPEGSTTCGDACVRDLSSNPDHCGECSRPCPPGQQCLQGECGIVCEPQRDACQHHECGQATNTCGQIFDCGTCGGNRVCLTGGDGTNCACDCRPPKIADDACNCSCPQGTTTCGAACVANLQTDPDHCGACDNACDPNQACSGGDCIVVCQPDAIACAFHECGDVVNNCGHVIQCGSCSERRVCRTGGDGTFCACDCPSSMSADVDCNCFCPAGTTDCGNVCIGNFHNNREHCGSCGHACDADMLCMGGNCVFAS